jgi:hypothetical protein
MLELPQACITMGVINICKYDYLVLDRIRAAPNDVVDDPEGFAERCLERTLDQIQIGSAKRRMDELQQLGN